MGAPLFLLLCCALLPILLYLQCSSISLSSALSSSSSSSSGGGGGSGSSGKPPQLRFGDVSDRGAALLHSWDDEELLARAAAAARAGSSKNRKKKKVSSSSSSSPSSSFASPSSSVSSSSFAASSSSSAFASPPAKVALLFLATGELPLQPLWEMFIRGNEELLSVYVHSHPFRFDIFPNRSSPFWGRCIASRPTSRATPSLIAATRRLLATALLDDPSNRHFALLSDSCIPLHGFRRLYKLLTSSPATSFLEISAESELLQGRYDARGEGVMLPEVERSQFRIGSQWFVMTREHAAMVVGDKRLWRKFRLPCVAEAEFSCYPEEHYFPTLLSMLHPGGCSNFSLTRVKWPPQTDGHPVTYHGEDVDQRLVREMQEEEGGRFMFARKFAPDALPPLLRLAHTFLKH